MSLTTFREHLGPGTGGRFSQVWLFWLLVVTSAALVIGPRPPTQPRDRRDLERGRVAAVTANLRAQLFAAFQDWVMEEEPQAPPVAEIAQRDPVQLALLLEEYGRTLYEQGATRRDYAETINVLVHSLSQRVSWRALNHMGNIVARESSSSHAAGAPESLCDNCISMGLEANCSESLARLLRLTSVLRAHRTESKRLSHDFRDRLQGRRLPAANTGEIQDSRSQDAKRQVRRTLCHQLHAELFSRLWNPQRRYGLTLQAFSV